MECGAILYRRTVECIALQKIDEGGLYDDETERVIRVVSILCYECNNDKLERFEETDNDDGMEGPK